MLRLVTVSHGISDTRCEDFWQALVTDQDNRLLRDRRYRATEGFGSRYCVVSDSRTCRGTLSLALKGHSRLLFADSRTA